MDIAQPARQAGATAQERDPAKSRTVPRRGRFGRRLGQAGRATAHFQAILPLKGKILNVETARGSTGCIGSKEIGTADPWRSAPASRDEFDLGKLRYHKIVIMTDADVDGAHIRTLAARPSSTARCPRSSRAGTSSSRSRRSTRWRQGRSEVYLKDGPALDRHPVEGGPRRAACWRRRAAARGGADPAGLVDHALPPRCLMAFAPKRHDPAIIEALALAGALEPDMTGTGARGRAGRKPRAGWTAATARRAGPRAWPRTAAIPIQRLWRAGDRRACDRAGLLQRRSAEAGAGGRACRCLCSARPAGRQWRGSGELEPEVVGLEDRGRRGGNHRRAHAPCRQGKRRITRPSEPPPKCWRTGARASRSRCLARAWPDEPRQLRQNHARSGAPARCCRSRWKTPT